MAMASTSVREACMFLWMGLTAAALSACMYGSAADVKPLSRTVKVSKTRYNYTVYWQGRRPLDIDAAVLRPPLNATSESLLGLIIVWDSFLTTQRDPNSTRVGRGRGLTTYDSLEEPGMMQYWETYFDRDFDLGGLSVKKGSALYFTGFHYAADSSTELAMVGGTGSFRNCHGYDVEHRNISESPVIEKIEIHFICHSF